MTQCQATQEMCCYPAATCLAAPDPNFILKFYSERATVYSDGVALQDRLLLLQIIEVRASFFNRLKVTKLQEECQARGMVVSPCPGSTCPGRCDNAFEQIFACPMSCDESGCSPVI